MRDIRKKGSYLNLWYNLDMRDHARVLKALAHHKRLEILKHLLSKREAEAEHIATHLKLSLESTSKHLNILVEHEILAVERNGPFVYYSVSKVLPTLAKIIVSTFS